MGARHSFKDSGKVAVDGGRERRINGSADRTVTSGLRALQGRKEGKGRKGSRQQNPGDTWAAGHCGQMKSVPSGELAFSLPLAVSEIQ